MTTLAHLGFFLVLITLVHSQGACPSNVNTWGRRGTFNNVQYWCQDTSATGINCPTPSTCACSSGNTFTCNPTLSYAGTIGVYDATAVSIAGSPFFASSSGNCFTLCQQTSNCQSWSYQICNSQSSNNCYLYSSVNNWNSPSACWVSAYKSGSTAAPSPTTPAPGIMTTPPATSISCFSFNGNPNGCAQQQSACAYCYNTNVCNPWTSQYCPSSSLSMMVVPSIIVLIALVTMMFV